MNKELLSELETLFAFAPPAELRKSLYKVYFQYIIHNAEIRPATVKNVSEDIYLLILFLEKAEEML
jgi:hypothetical protein